MLDPHLPLECFVICEQPLNTHNVFKKFQFERVKEKFNNFSRLQKRSILVNRLVYFIYIWYNGAHSLRKDVRNLLNIGINLK